jgi:hypothetical protein
MRTRLPWGRIFCRIAALREVDNSFEISKLLDFTRQRSKSPTADNVTMPGRASQRTRKRWKPLARWSQAVRVRLGHRTHDVLCSGQLGPRPRSWRACVFDRRLLGGSLANAARPRFTSWRPVPGRSVGSTMQLQRTENRAWTVGLSRGDKPSERPLFLTILAKTWAPERHVQRASEIEEDGTKR